MYSPRYYSPEGYAYQIAIYLREMLFGVCVCLVSGKYDDQLQWPCHHRQVTIQLLDQNPHIQQRMSKQISITTEPSPQDGKRNSKIQYKCVQITTNYSKGIAHFQYIFLQYSA